MHFPGRDNIMEAKSSPPLKVAVIGAGMAGLCAARELLREGLQVVVFENNNQIGGTWVYDPRADSDPLSRDPNREIVHSSMYRCLRVNLPRQLMSFLDYPFSASGREDGDPRAFPGHEEVLRFLNDFAREFGLLDHIRFGHEVVRVEQIDGHHSWEVGWRRSGSESESDSEIFDAAVVCSGKHAQPVTAEFPGMNVWPGLQIHCHNYRVSDPYKDQIVVIIGNGASALDIMRDVSSVAKQVHQASRTQSLIQILYGTGTYRIHSMIKRAYEDGKLDFEDGSSIYADAIIHCTGYRYHFPFLRTNDIVKVEDNRVGPLYQHVFPPRLAPWLSFVGIPYMTVIAFAMVELQSKWVAKVLSGKLALPTEDEMANSVLDFYRQLDETGRPKRFTHRLQMNCEYENWLVAQLDLPPLEKWRQQLMPTMISDVLRSHDANFRDTWDVDQWIQETQSSPRHVEPSS